MKLKLTLILSLIILSTSIFAQKAKPAATKKPQLFGVNLLLVDYNSSNGIKHPGTGKGYSPIKDMSKGIGFSYWRGLTSTVDFSAKLNAILNDYNLTQNKTELGVELEPTVNIRPMGDNAKLAPFLTTGVGVGVYSGDFGAYVPAGVGLQLNSNSNAYFFLQAQYRFSLTKKIVGDNLFYSIGFAENF